MKYSQIIGIVAALALIGICFMPWVTIPGKQIILTGLKTEGTSFGKPGLFLIYFSVPAILFFAIPRIWAKRTNIFIVTLVFAWTIRNFILLSTCMAGECPAKHAGLYLQMITAFIMLLMTFFPKVELKKNN
jgi:hypothetical protein